MKVYGRSLCMCGRRITKITAERKADKVQHALKVRNQGRKVMQEDSGKVTVRSAQI